MRKRRSRSEKLDTAGELGDLLLAGVSGAVVGCLFAAAAYVIASAVAGRGAAFAGAIIVFPVGFVAGLLAYRFRWFLRSMFD